MGGGTGPVTGMIGLTVLPLVFPDAAACSDRGGGVQLQPEGRPPAEDVPVHIASWRRAGDDTDTGHHRQAIFSHSALLHPESCYKTVVNVSPRKVCSSDWQAGNGED